MFEILVSFFDLVGRYVLWLYLLCAAAVLYNLRNYVIARRARVNTIFSVEREVSAHREQRSMTNVGLMLGIVAVILALEHYVAPVVDVLEVVAPTPTIALAIPTPTLEAPTPVLEPTPQPTAQPLPTATPPPPATPVPIPTVAPPPAAACPDPNVCISSPGPGARLAGVVTIRGTARHPNFQFFKIEHGVGEAPDAWHSIGDEVRSQVSDGTLMQFDTRALPNGVYWLKLTVVDITSNFPPPYRVRVVIEN